MKFTEGYWVKKEGYLVEHPRQVQEIAAAARGIVAYAPTRVVHKRGGELDSPMLTTTVEAVAPDVVRVRQEHFRGTVRRGPHFRLAKADVTPEVAIEGKVGRLRVGDLEVRIGGEDSYGIDFYGGGELLTSVGPRSTGVVTAPDGTNYIHEQLTLDVGDAVYGLGERFGPAVKNGQTVDIWNDDGGTATEHAYKNVPFYLTNAGYGVLVNHTEHVSFEVGSEVNTRVQFSVAGQALEYLFIYGPTPKEILGKYTALTGRAPQVPAWSYGLWLSTSFTTDYAEDTVNAFVDRMAESSVPLSVLHFDAYWMRASHWCDFVWDPEKFPDPAAMLRRFHDRGLRISVWINPYIAQRSHLFDEGMANGYLLRSSDGAVRQWDHWQSGMAWVDFTNPDATTWWKGELKKLLSQGVDAFKTDFGERVPTDVEWFDGSDPGQMHNYYSYLYNRAAFEAIAEVHGEAEAIVFARSATAGGQAFPVHWGGDSEPTFVSMAETLRGGLSLGMSGFGYWSHDMGGFEGTPRDDVFIRWFPFGMLTSHSRLHGAHSYRVPWNYGETAMAVARRFVALKNRLMPYIGTHARAVTDEGLPLLRHMILEYPDDRGSTHVGSQYLLGPDLLVAPVFSETGAVDVYLPSDGWTDVLSGQHVDRAGWHHQVHELTTLPLLVPDGTALPVGADPTRPDYDWLDDLTLYLFRPTEGTRTVTVTTPDGRSATFRVRRAGSSVSVATDSTDSSWRVVVIGASPTVVRVGIEDTSGRYGELCPGTALTPTGSSVEFDI